MAGKAVNLAQYKGQVVMINFWATWCGPCRAGDAHAREAACQVQAHGLHDDRRERRAGFEGRGDWLKATPVTFPILFDTKSEVSKLYTVAGMPSTVIVDRKGNVRWLHRGYKPGDENEYLNQIRALVRE